MGHKKNKEICGGCGEPEYDCCCEQNARNAAGMWMMGLFSLGVAVFFILKFFGVILK